jgi:hypothetical protein
VTSTIYEVVPRSRILWGGTASGINGVHEWLFETTPGGVRVTTNESFAGEPVDADKDGMQTALDGSLGTWLAHLKAAAESRREPHSRLDSVQGRVVTIQGKRPAFTLK